MSKKKAEKTEDKENLKREDKLTTNQWFPLVVAFLIIAFGLVLGYLFGFRITYAPELENSWDAISGVADWVSAAATLAAVWAAVQIPKKIAERQDKIALINSRLEIADKIEDISISIRVSYDILNHVQRSQGIDDSFLLFLSYAMDDEFQKNRNIIRKYDLYFSKYTTCMSDWRLLYTYINIDCMKLDRARERNDRDKSILIKELIESISEANKFVHSEQFKQWKAYMHETISITK